MRPGARAILPLTGLRAFAAGWVVFHHLRVAVRTLVDWEPLNHFLARGYLGVDLFAFLSGFVIAYNYAAVLGQPGARPVGRFLWIRAVRIFPLHLFTIVLLLLARATLAGFGDSGIDRGRYETDDLVLNLLMVHGWGFADGLSWDSPSWTVSSEWLCYLLFPLGAPLLARVGTRGAALVAAVLLFVATTGALHVVGHPEFDATVHWGALRIGGLFACGALLFRMRELGVGSDLPWEAVAPLALLAGIGLTQLDGSAAAAGIVSCCGLLVYAVAHERGSVAAVLASRPVVYLGEISYSIYLMHWVCLMVLQHVLPRPFAGLPAPWSAVLGLALYLAVILAASAASFHGVEQPARRALRRLVVA
jgi:peptidoglycan/LPS O-acetylase OafA/YrhL